MAGAFGAPYTGYGSGMGEIAGPASLGQSRGGASDFDLAMRQMALQQQQQKASLALAQQNSLLNAQTQTGLANISSNTAIRTVQEQNAAANRQADVAAQTAQRGQDAGLSAVNLNNSAAFQRLQAELGSTNSIAQMQNSTTQRGQDISLQAANLPFQFKQGLLNQFSGTLQNAIHGLGATFDPKAWTAGVGHAPNVGVGAPIADQGNLLGAQMQVDRGRTDQAAANQQRNVTEDLAARGFGPNSPLALALRQGIGTGAQVANSEAAAATRAKAAELNLTAQQANQQNSQFAAQLAQQQWNDYQTATANQAKIGLGAYSQQSQNSAAILAALTGLIG